MNDVLRRRGRGGQSRQPNPVFAPISAAGFFDQALQISVADSGLEFRVYYTPPKSDDGTVFICHHGAGWSGLTYAAFAKEVARVGKGECGGGVGGGGKTERGYEGGIDEEGAEVLGSAAHGHGGRPPVAGGSGDGHGGFVGIVDDIGAVFKL